MLQRTTVHGAVGLGLLLGSLLAVPARLPAASPAPVDPADRPLHRHLLPPDAARLALDAGEVRVLSWEELLATLDAGRAARRAARGKEEADAPGRAPFLLRDLEAAVQVAADEEDAALTLEVTLELREAGWTVLPLLGPGPVPARLTASGGPAHWVSSEGGSGVLVEGPGTRRITLGAHAAVRREGHLRRVEVPLPPVPGARARFEIPGTDLHVFTDPAPEPTHLEEVGGRTRAAASLPPGAPLRIQWFPRDAGLAARAPEDDRGGPPAPPGLEALGPLARATWGQTLVFGHGRLEGRVRLRVRVHRAGVERLGIRVTGSPENLTVLRSGPVREVLDVDGGADVLLRGRRREELVLEARYRIQREEASFQVEVPRFSLLVDGAPAFSERHFYWIGRATNVRVAPPEGEGFEPASASDFSDFPPHPAVQDALMRYRRVAPDAPLVLEVERYPDASGVLTEVVDSLRVQTHLGAHGRAASTLIAHLRSRTGAPLEVLLPPDAEPVGFFVGPRRVDPPRGEDGIHRISLRDGDEAGTDAAEVRVEYHHDVPRLGEMGGAWVTAARVGVPVMDLEWSVVAPDEFLLHAAPPGATLHPQGETLTLRRRLLPRPGDLASTPPLRLELRAMSYRVRDVLRALGLALGLWAGLLLCRVLVGALPLELAVGLLAPLLLLALTPDPGALHACTAGFATATLAGVMVGLRRWVATARLRRQLRRERARRMEEALADYRARVAETIPEEAAADTEPPDPPPPPAPEAPAPDDEAPGEEES